MPARKVITEDQEHDMVAQYEGGASIYAIGAALGCAPQTVHKALQRRQVSMRAKGGRDDRPFLPRERAEIATRYLAGETARAIAQSLDRPTQSVYRVLSSDGIPRRSRGARTVEAFAPDELARVIDLHEAGVRPSGIAAELGRGYETVRRLMLSAGITPHHGTGTGPHSPGWKGGRVVLGGGYIGVWTEPDDPMRVMSTRDGHVMEHRLVMARALGRPLDATETVHHVNGVRDDNALSNLQLRTGRHGKGAAFECADCGSRNVQAVELA